MKHYITSLRNLLKFLCKFRAVRKPGILSVICWIDHHSKLNWFQARGLVFDFSRYKVRRRDYKRNWRTDTDRLSELGLLLFFVPGIKQNCSQCLRRQYVNYNFSEEKQKFAMEWVEMFYSDSLPSKRSRLTKPAFLLKANWKRFLIIYFTKLKLWIVSKMRARNHLSKSGQCSFLFGIRHRKLYLTRIVCSPLLYATMFPQEIKRSKAPNIILSYSGWSFTLAAAKSYFVAWEEDLTQIWVISVRNASALAD